MDVEEAHRYSSGHRAEIEASIECGCFYCLKRYPPLDIAEWIDQGSTALCPRCGVDSVIGSASGIHLSESFLERMRIHWFGSD